MDELELLEAQALLDKVDESISADLDSLDGVRIRYVNNKLVLVYDNSPRSEEMEIMQASQYLEDLENENAMGGENSVVENMKNKEDLEDDSQKTEEKDNDDVNLSASKENERPSNLPSASVTNNDNMRTDGNADITPPMVGHVEVAIEMQEEDKEKIMEEAIEKEEDGEVEAAGTTGSDVTLPPNEDNEDVVVNESHVEVEIMMEEETMDLAIEEQKNDAHDTEKEKEKEIEKGVEVSPAKEKKLKKDKSFLHMASWPAFLRNENRSFNFHYPFRLFDPEYLDASKYQVIIYWNRTSVRAQDNLALQLCLKVHQETALPLLVVNMVNEWDYMIMNEMGTSLQKEGQVYTPRRPPVEKVLKHTGVWWSKQRKTLMRMRLLHSLNQELTSRGIATYTLIQKGMAEEQTMSTFLRTLNHYSQKVKKRGELDVLATFTDDLHNPYDRHMMETMTEEKVGCLSDAAVFSVDSNSVFIPCKDNNNTLNEDVQPMEYEDYSGQYQQHFAQMNTVDKTSDWNFTNIGDSDGDSNEDGTNDKDIDKIAGPLLHEEPIPVASIRNSATCAVVTPADWQTYAPVFQWYDSLMQETSTSLQGRPFDMAVLRWKRGEEHKYMSTAYPPFEPFSFLVSDAEMLLQLGMISPLAIATLVRSVSSTDDNSSLSSPRQQYVDLLLQQLCQMDYARHVSRTYILNVRNRRREEIKKLRAQAAADSALAININLVIPLQDVPWMDLFCDFLKKRVCEIEYISHDSFDGAVSLFLNATMNEAHEYLHSSHDKGATGKKKRVKRYDTLFSKQLCEGRSSDVLFNALQRCLIEYGTTPKGLALQYWSGYYLCHCTCVQEGLTMALMEATRHSLVSSGEMASVIVPVLVAAAAFVCKEIAFYRTSNLTGSDDLFNSMATELKIMLGDKGEDTKLLRFTQTFVSKTK